MTIPLSSIERHVIFSQGEAQGFCDGLTLLSDLFESFIDWRIKILLAALRAHPGWDMINIERLPMEMKTRPDLALFYRSFTKLAQVASGHCFPPLLPLLPLPHML